MSRTWFTSRSLLAVLCLAALADGVALAQQKRPLEIESVKVGLPGGPKGERRVRLGAWSPIYVSLTAGKEDLSAGEYELVSEASDGDSQAQFFTRVPAMQAKEQRTVLTYYRPGDREGAVRITLRTHRGSTVQSAGKEPEFSERLNPDELLYLVVGAELGGLRSALLPPNVRAGGVVEDELDLSRADRWIARIDTAAHMPAQWFGYQAADVVVLATSNTKFVEALLARHPHALEALGEWVRRGGRLVLGVGKNFQLAKDVLAKMGIADFKLERSERVTALTGLSALVGKQVPNLEWRDGFDVTRASLREGAIPLASDERGGKKWPVVALSPCGMGRVMLVAFDFDTPAFTGWKGQGAFWQTIHSELAPKHGRLDKNAEGLERGNELAGNLQRGLETFDEVPVISFGWVAFFILIYILIVGPLDYLFLKKVVKRLELTWVTFPLVVLVVSVAAYVTAYKLKGNHLRVNKIDVVDINLRDNQVQGTTWFSIFSPRVQSYTVGVEAAPEWSGGAKAGEDTGFNTVVTTLSPPDSSIGGVDRPGSQSLFRRPYQYAEDASALRGVPVPVWASRSFTASWGARINRNQLIEVTDDFALSADGLRLSGKLRSHLPVELTEVSLYYAEQWHSMPNVPANGPYPVNELVIQSGKPIPQWLAIPFRRIEKPQKSERPSGNLRKDEWDERGRSVKELGFHSDRLMKSVLFHSAPNNPKADEGNSGLRSLDQGWRLRPVRRGDRERHPYLDEAILVGRATQTPASAEEVSQAGVSATRLWLGRLPGEGERESLKGFLGQDTYVRVYIPVPRKAD